jgi:hypothetical protein
MKQKFKLALASVCVVAAGFGGMKAYNAANQSEADLLLSENVEALSSSESPAKGIYLISTGPCHRPCSYKKWVRCTVGGHEECQPSDCC